VQSCYEPVPVITVTAWVLPSITADLPSRQLFVSVSECCCHLKLVDTSFDTPAQVELLLGADVFPQMWIDEQCSLGRGLPMAYSSTFGWVLIGPVSLDASPSAQCLLATLNPSIKSLIGDLESLTPGHFLIGQPLLCVPEPNCLDTPGRLTSKWNLFNQCHQAFWKR